MVSASLMEILVPGSTSGPLVVQLGLVAVLVLLMLPLHHLLVKTTSARRPMITVNLNGLECSLPMTPSGMAKTVGHLIPVNAPSTIPPGSVSSCPRPQLMTSRFVFAVKKTVLMRILQWNVSNSTFANEFYRQCDPTVAKN